MTSASTTLQVRLPRALRESASSALEEMGLDLSTAVRLYLTKVAKTRRIPFPLEAEPVALRTLRGHFHAAVREL